MQSVTDVKSHVCFSLVQSYSTGRVSCFHDDLQDTGRPTRCLCQNTEPATLDEALHTAHSPVLGYPLLSIVIYCFLLFSIVYYFCFLSKDISEPVLSYFNLSKGVESALLLLPESFLHKYLYFYLSTQCEYFCHLSPGLALAGLALAG